MEKKSISFTNFGRTDTGVVIIEDESLQVVFARNPYGTHNLVLVLKEDNTAFVHGNDAVIKYLPETLAEQAYDWVNIRNHFETRDSRLNDNRYYGTPLWWMFHSHHRRKAIAQARDKNIKSLRTIDGPDPHWNFPVPLYGVDFEAPIKEKTFEWQLIRCESFNGVFDNCTFKNCSFHNSKYWTFRNCHFIGEFRDFEGTIYND